MACACASDWLAMPTLHCEIGNHKYWRDPQRGRLPRNCPEHQPKKHEVRVLMHPDVQKAISQTMPSIEHYERSVLDVIPGLTEALKYETLHCELGDHDWDWERKRGRKPSSCPEHRSQPSSRNLSNKTTNSQAKLIESVLSRPGASQCHCGITPQTSPPELREMEGGCTSTAWKLKEYREQGINFSPGQALSLSGYICPTLDSIRRQIGM